MLHRRTFLTGTLALPTAALLATPALAATPPIYTEAGIALGGTDPVAYFTENAPKAGSADITYDWNGATWRFTSEDHAARFAAEPEAYAPQFGGYCAWAVSRGYTASTVPEAWKIVDGRLYRNYSLRVQRRWSRDIPGNIARGNANWPSVLTA